MSIQTGERPPLWLIALLALPVLLALGVMYVGLSFSGPRLRATDIFIYSAPFIVTLGAGGLSWLAGSRTVAICTASFTPVTLLISLVFLLGIGI